MSSLDPMDPLGGGGSNGVGGGNGGFLGNGGYNFVVSGQQQTTTPSLQQQHQPQFTNANNMNFAFNAVNNSNNNGLAANFGNGGFNFSSSSVLGGGGGGIGPGMGMGMGIGIGMGGGGPGTGVTASSSSSQEDLSCRCARCGFGGSDVTLVSCGCSFHTRCLAIPTGNLNPESGISPLQVCPNPSCNGLVNQINLIPMSFDEIDKARKQAQEDSKKNKGKSRKRKSLSGSNDGSSSVTDAPKSDPSMMPGGYVSDRRTGRWTQEEMKLSDKMILKFESGELPIGGNLKLNEFLGNMLKSKQSRLTKKMKNAKLSARTFQRTSGYIIDHNEAREFSELEESFFQKLSVTERASIRFHMQREWREQFTQYCASIGQSLDADEWLSSVEEMDRRESQAKDAARMAKRQLMMGKALRADTQRQEAGVFIEKSESDERVALGTALSFDDDLDEQSEILKFLAEEATNAVNQDINGKSSLLHSAPFLAKTVAYMQRHSVPFEHVDLWVPSFVPNDDVDPTNCRLCFAGSATLDDVLGADGSTKKAITHEEQFNLYAFGDYSQKFSFDVGCGLPGRVYESGRPTWEQSVHRAPDHHFERCGGALQWGIKTVVGIPVASPNVGRIVVVLYSTHDRSQDQDLVGRLTEEFTRLMPNPKWKLVVDVGDQEPVQQEQEKSSDGQGVVDSAGEVSSGTVGRDPRIDEVVAILGELMPTDPNSALQPYMSGFINLRLLLLRPSRSPEDESRAQTMLNSYTSFLQAGRSRNDIGVMLAREYMCYFNSGNDNNTANAAAPSGNTNSLQSQQVNFFNLGQGVATTNNASSSLSVHPPSLSGNLLDFEVNSPVLAPIPVPPGNDSTLSIVSN